MTIYIGQPATMYQATIEIRFQWPKCCQVVTEELVFRVDKSILWLNNSGSFITLRAGLHQRVRLK